MANISGIYTITNTSNNKIYVGYASSISNRISHHKLTLSTNMHRNSYLQNAYNKYGKESFKFEILEECPIDYLVALEHYWCTILNSHNRKFGYNIEPTNPYSRYPSRSEETKNKVRKARKNQVITEQHKNAISRALKGRKGISRIISQNTKNKIRESLFKTVEKRGYWRTKQQRDASVKIQRSINGKYVEIIYPNGTQYVANSLSQASEITNIKIGTIWANIKNNRINKKTGIQFKYKEV